MLKTTLSRQTRLCCLPLAAARNVQLASRVASRPLLVQSLAPSTRLVSLNALSALSRYQPRLYSTDAATATSEVASQGPREISRFPDLESIGVHDSIVRAITKDFGYEDMTDVQRMTINAALAGRDMVAQAKTGTGKTLAFLVPVLQRILTQDPSLATRSARHRASSDDIRAIIISPTRELAQQIAEEAEKLAKHTGIVVQLAVGGNSKRFMLSKTQREGCHILVATPGRLNDLLEDKYSGIDAPKVSALVLDEADRMLDVGFSKELENIVRMLPSRAEVPRQTLLFSATIPKSVISLAKTYVDPKNFEFVQTISEDEEPTHHKVPQHIVTVDSLENMFPTILELMEREIQAATTTGEPFKAIVFIPTTTMVQLVHSFFMALRVTRGVDDSAPAMPQISLIHSKLTQQQRTYAADRFKRAVSGILFSSDVTARGMDFPNVTHVIQFGPPPTREQYIHRLGRTGRAGKNGQGWLLVTEAEVRSCRSRLPGLPIQKHTGLTSATLDMSNEQVKSGEAEGSDHAMRTIKAFDRVSPSLLEESYISLLGPTYAALENGEEVVRVLNSYAKTFGLPEPPSIPPRVAQSMGLSRVRGVRIGGRASRSSFGGRDGGSGESDDPFNKAFGSEGRSGGYRSRSDRGGARGGFGGNRDGGRSGGFGGNRDGGRSGGFGGDRDGGRGGGFGGNRDGGRSGGFGGNREGGQSGGFGGSRDGGRSGGFGGSSRY